MIDRSYPDGLDCVWIAVDNSGALAAFITGGSGPIPLSIICSDLWEPHKSEEFILALPKISTSILLASVKYPESYIEIAERGAYVYDWLDVHRVKSAARNVYEIVARPKNPIKIEENFEAVSGIPTNFHFDGNFENMTSLDVRSLVPCREAESQ